MSRIRWSAPILCILSAIAGLSLRAQQSLPEVRLEMHDDKSQLMMGDRIMVDLVFRSATTGEDVVDVMDDFYEKVEITPATGWLEWRDNRTGMKDEIEHKPLGTEEIRVPLTLNHGFVFRQPGHYEVRVTTKRLIRTLKKSATTGEDETSPNPAITTNSVSFDLSPMPAAVEAQRVRALLAEIASTGTDDRDDILKRDDLFAQLAALQGDDAVRAKVGLLVAQDETMDDVMGEAMESTLNLPLQLAQLQAAWNDVSQAPLRNIASAMSITRGMMRFLKEGKSASPPTADKAKAAQRLSDSEYLADLDALIRSLPQRAGESRTGAAYYLLSDRLLPPEKLAAVRSQLMPEFPRMDKEQQEILLGDSWQKIRDPALIGTLRAMLDAQPNDGTALRRLIDLDASVAKPYTIRAICHGVQLQTVKDVPDAALPEVDGCLGDQLGIPILKIDQVYAWHERAMLAARFATAAALPAIRKGWTDDYEDGPVLALLLRYEPAEAIARIETVRVPRYAHQNLDMRFRDIATVFEARHSPLPEEFRAWLQQTVAAGPKPRAQRAANLLAAEKQWLPKPEAASSTH